MKKKSYLKLAPRFPNKKNKLKMAESNATKKNEGRVPRSEPAKKKVQVETSRREITTRFRRADKNYFSNAPNKRPTCSANKAVLCEDISSPKTQQ